MNNRNLSERGQILILIVLSFTVLLGFTALAIDGGMVYSDRRFAQNGADASSLAGGGAAALSLENSYMSHEDWNNCADVQSPNRISAAIAAAEAAAISRAGDNSFTIDYNLSDNHGVDAVCGQFDSGAWIDKYIDVRTLISSTTKTSFAHFVFGGQLINNVEAVTRVRPRSSLAYGQAIVALNDAACSGNNNGMIFTGEITVTVNGGGIFSNGCLTGQGTDFGVEVTGGTISYAGSQSGNWSGTSPSPTFVPLTVPASSYSVPPPDCTGLIDRGQSTGGGTISPGVYSKISLSSGSLTMNTGLYCITGSTNAFKITGGRVTGVGVTIYVENGNISISGDTDVSDPGLIAPVAVPDPPYDYGIPGILFFLPLGNSGTVKLSGNSDSMYVGTIYAPDGDINVTGESDLETGFVPTFNTQLIGNNVKVSGDATIDINFNVAENYIKPSLLELSK